MRSVISYSLQPIDAYSSVNLNSGYTSGIDELYLNKLYEKISCDDLESFELLHGILYPLLFDYVFFIIKDAAVADSIIAESFISFWNTKEAIKSRELKISIVKQIRCCVLAYLTDGANHSTTNNKTSLSLLRVLNSSRFKEREANFFMYDLKLDHSDITELMNNIL